MKKNLNFILIFSCLILIFTSCGKNITEDVVASSGQRIMMKSAPKMAVTNSSADFSEAVVEESWTGKGFSPEGPGNSSVTEQSSSQVVERKLIKRGNVNIEVQNLKNAQESVEKWCKDFGGYIESFSENTNSANFNLRIPSVKFDEALNSVGEFGTVKSKNISTQDVSEQFYDLQGRLATKKIMQERLQKYLTQAKDVKDMLQIEKELNNTISEIESMEGRMKRLSGQIEYSSVNIFLELPYRTSDEGFVWPDFLQGFREFLSNCVDFFVGLFGIMVYAIVFGVPIIAILAFLYWLLIGKKGLLIKLFKKLSK
ncbi:MAG: DUF4349 domain-containing protein [Spirochaetaceae bacterium]|nr:DUF4349 domain-containing protein [Spirochaetaceae bacterium]